MESPLPHNIKIIRALTGVKQEDFAKNFTKVTRNMQQSYESGKAEPDVLYLRQLARMTGLTVEQLISENIDESKVNIVENTENVSRENEVSRQDNPDAMYTTPINTSGKGTRLAMLSEKDQQIAELKDQVKWLKERLTEALQETKELRTMLANSMQKS